MKAFVENGTLTKFPEGAWSKLWAKHEGKWVEVTCKPWADDRTTQQSRYYFAEVVPKAQQVFLYLWGQRMTKEAAHETLRMLFLGREVVNHSTGEVLRVARSTTELTTKEMTEYIETIKAWAYDYAQIVIEPPPYKWGEE